MGVPPTEIQALLYRETLGLLASYSWQATVMLEPVEFGVSEVDLTLPEFFREFRFRHAIATAQRLPEIISAIEANPSNNSGIERAESRGVIRGRLDTPRYMARRATLRSLPRRYPIIRSRWTYDTPENVLARLALGEVRTAMRDNPFPPRGAEGMAAIRNLRWVADRLSHRPWDEVRPRGLPERLYNEVDARIRRRQTGNEIPYNDLMAWFDQWSLDLHRMDPEAREDVIRSLLAFPGGDSFWDKVFEVWCLLFVASTLSGLGWTRTEGPAALHHASGIIYRYLAPAGREVLVRFQRHKPLETGNWTYRGGGALRGIPDVSVSTARPGPFPLIVDAKNRYIHSDRVSRAGEIYKMLGYAENFRPRDSSGRFRGVLIFPSNRSEHRILDGPNRGRLDLILVDLGGDRTTASGALAQSIIDWAAALS